MEVFPVSIIIGIDHGYYAIKTAHGCKIYLVQMKSNIQCDFECDFLLYLRTLPFNLTV